VGGLGHQLTTTAAVRSGDKLVLVRACYSDSGRSSCVADRTHGRGGGCVSSGQHRNTSDNDVKGKWTFNDANKKRLQEIIKQYPPQYKKAAVIPALDLAQRQVRPHAADTHIHSCVHRGTSIHIHLHTEAAARTPVAQ
jgi:hypothetical protein